MLPFLDRHCDVYDSNALMSTRVCDACALSTLTFPLGCLSTPIPRFLQEEAGISAEDAKVWVRRLCSLFVQLLLETQDLSTIANKYDQRFYVREAATDQGVECVADDRLSLRAQSHPCCKWSRTSPRTSLQKIHGTRATIADAGGNE